MFVIPYTVEAPPYDASRPVDWKRIEHRDGSFYVQFAQQGTVYAGRKRYSTYSEAKPELARIP